MTDKIRLRVWLAAIGPIVLVAALVAYLLMPHEKPAARGAPETASGGIETPTPGALPVPTPTRAASAPLPTPAPGPVATSVPVGSSAALGPPSEPLPELDALYGRPRGAEGWSDDQKSAYRKKVFDDLDAKERTLEREIAAAHRAGDTGTEQEKTATLSYLRQKRAEAEELMRARLEAGPPVPVQNSNEVR
jgi:hypothetical protein